MIIFKFMKNTNYLNSFFCFLSVWFFLAGIIGKENCFAAVENGSSLTIIENQREFYLTNRLTLEKRNLLFLLKKEVKKSPPLKIFSESEIFQKSIFQEENTKLEFSYPFPFKAYAILMTMIKTDVSSADSRCFEITREEKKPLDPSKKIKLTVIFQSTETLSPEEDMESYGIVYLDKKKIGMTEQKLLSQPKIIETEVTFERHLLRLEVYVQDPYKKAWVRLKNIDQPQPKYFIPQEGKDGMVLTIIYFPKNEKNKYQYEGSFYKQ